MSHDDPAGENAFAQALTLFNLEIPFTREMLEVRRRDLLTMWNPHRYANLTNNPRKYMHMYKKGEAMTREVEAAYALLDGWLQRGGDGITS